MARLEVVHTPLDQMADALGEPVLSSRHPGRSIRLGPEGWELECPCGWTQRFVFGTSPETLLAAWRFHAGTLLSARATAEEGWSREDD